MHLPADLVSKPLVVLVADDDDDFRALVVAALQADGHTTFEAHDGHELLLLLEQTKDGAPSLRPDVLITDVKMPKLSGLGVLEALRSARWDLPVVVMTVFSDDSIDTVALRLGAVGVLHKPFETADLLTALVNAKAVTARNRVFRY